MKPPDIEARFYGLRKSGNDFTQLIATETDFNSMLDRNPEDEEDVFVGVSAFTE